MSFEKEIPLQEVTAKDPESEQLGPIQEDQNDQTSEKGISHWKLAILVFFSLLSVVTHFLDVGTDVALALNYSTDHQMVNFGWTVLFIVLPIIVTITWIILGDIKDYKNESIPWKNMAKYIFLYVFQMWVIKVFINNLRYAWKSHKAGKKGDAEEQSKWHREILKENSEAVYFKMLECFLESAPQLVLQLSLMIEGRANIKTVQILSVGTSLISMAWCLISIRRARRFRENKKDKSMVDTIILFLCHFLITVSRMLSIAVVVYLSPLWTMIACWIHTVVMAEWQYYYNKKLDVGVISVTVIGRLSFGFVYIFAYVPFAGGQEKNKIIFYYAIYFVEHTVCTILWYFCTDPSIQNWSFFQPIIILTTVPYLLGIILMALYYKFLHPTVGILNKPNEVAALDCTSPTTEETNSST